MWGHMSTRYLGTPTRSSSHGREGCRLWDVDGNEYVDLMCSWGPIVLGHHPLPSRTRRGGSGSVATA